jgi:hypothetical protein
MVYTSPLGCGDEGILVLSAPCPGSPESCAACRFPGFQRLYESPSVIPAKAGIQVVFLDSGFRRYEDERPLRTLMVRCDPWGYGRSREGR